MQSPRTIITPCSACRIPAEGILLILLLACGCQSHRGGFFPIGLYGVDSKDYHAVRQAGFNLVTSPASRSALDAAERENLRVLAIPGTQAGAKFSAPAARLAVTRFDAHPALWGWYLCDEPDLNDVAPEQLLLAHRFLKSIGAKRPTVTVIMSGGASLDYANITDIFMLDRYPIPWQPLSTFPQHLRMARLALGPRKPLLAVIQAFDWEYDKTALGVEVPFRPPNFDELRCMTYCALESQVSGLMYFANSMGDWHLPDHPETWSALQRVVREVHDRQPLFKAQSLWWPARHRYVPKDSGWNESLQSSVSPSLWRVRHGNQAVPSGRYIVAVNTTGRRIEYQLRVSDLGIVQSAVVGEGRLLVATNGWFSDNFSPYGVHIYGPF